MNMANKKLYRLLIYGLMAVAVLLFILLSEKARAAVVVSIFIFVNMIITTYKKFLKAPIEIEVLTLGIVLSTLEYGVAAGLIVAILGWILGFFVGLDISPFALPMFLGYLVVVLASYILQPLNITIIGITASLINNIIIFMIYHFLLRYDVGKNLSFGLSNLMFNVILFNNIAPVLQSLLS
jgi:hypothetical protein